jgi:hypothetical protein
MCHDSQCAMIANVLSPRLRPRPDTLSQLEEARGKAARAARRRPSHYQVSLPCPVLHCKNVQNFKQKIRQTIILADSVSTNIYTAKIDEGNLFFQSLLYSDTLLRVPTGLCIHSQIHSHYLLKCIDYVYIVDS